MAGSAKRDTGPSATVSHRAPETWNVRLWGLLSADNGAGRAALLEWPALAAVRIPSVRPDRVAIGASTRSAAR